MRVGYVTTQFPGYVTSGLGRYIEAMTPRLMGRGCQLVVCTLNPGDLPELTRTDAAVVHRPITRLQRRLLAGRQLNRTRRRDFMLLAGHVVVSNLWYVGLLTQQHRQRRLDVIVVHDTTNIVAALLLSALLRVPLVLHMHTLEYSHETSGTVVDSTGLLGRAERILARRCAAIVVPSPEVAETLLGDGWPPDRLIVIPQGNPFDDLLPDENPEDSHRLREELQLADDDVMVLFVGRFEPAKGASELVSGWASVVREHPRAHLVMLGEGDAEALRAIARSDQISSQVHIVSAFVAHQELRRWYQAADLCVFPSRYEPFGLVALEAMSQGCPVVLGAGFSSLLHGVADEPAAVVTVVHPEAIAATLNDLLADPDRLTRLSENGRAWARRFHWDHTADATVQAYADAACLA